MRLTFGVRVIICPKGKDYNVKYTVLLPGGISLIGPISPIWLKITPQANLITS